MESLAGSTFPLTFQMPKRAMHGNATAEAVA
jgi:hypothetical protein